MKDIIFTERDFKDVIHKCKTQVRQIMCPQPRQATLIIHDLKGNAEEIIATILKPGRIYSPGDIIYQNESFIIKVTDIWFEQVHDISDDDCYAEGIWALGTLGSKDYTYHFAGAPEFYPTPQQAYAALFDQTNGVGAWDDNPWVWCYGLKLIGV